MNSESGYRKLLRRAGISLGALALVSTGLVTLGTAQAGAVKYKGTITIGMVLPFSGALAASGDNTLDGANVAVKQINAAGGVLGKKLVIRTLNETGVATDATNAVRELNSDKIKLQVGFALSGDCTAVGPVAASLGDLMMGTCTGDGFRSAKAYPAFWTVSTDNQDQADGAAAEMAKLNPTEVDTFAYSYTEGYSAWDDIQAVLNDDGITFTSPIQDFVSTSAPDFTTQVSAMASQLTGSSAQRVLSLLTYGGGNTLFLEEAKTYGVLPDYEGIFADGEYYDTALSLGANAPAVWDSYDYCDWQAYNNPVNNAFVKAYHAATKSYPSDWAEEGYLEMESVAKAITTAKSTTTKAVEAALGKITVTQSPVGPFTFNVATHQANVPITTCETEGNASSPAGVKLLKVVKTQIGVG